MQQHPYSLYKQNHIGFMTVYSPCITVSGNFHLSHVQVWWAPLYSSCPRQKHIHCIAACSWGFYFQGNIIFAHGPYTMEELSFKKWLQKVLWKIKNKSQLLKPQATVSYLPCWFNVSDTEFFSRSEWGQNTFFLLLCPKLLLLSMAS